MKNKEKSNYPDPPHLTATTKHFYDLLLFLLQNESGFKEADTFSLQILAQAFVDYREAQLKLDEEGYYYNSGKMERVSPAYAIRSEAEKTIRDLSDRFGLSPKAREKMRKFGNFKELPDALDMI